MVIVQLWPQTAGKRDKPCEPYAPWVSRRASIYRPERDSAASRSSTVLPMRRTRHDMSSVTAGLAIFLWSRSEPQPK